MTSEVHPSAESGNDLARVQAWVHGHVQGVGFRWWTRSRALELSLVGYAANQRDGRVLVVAEGARENVQKLVTLLSEQPSTSRRPGQVTVVVDNWEAPRTDMTGFIER